MSMTKFALSLSFKSDIKNLSLAEDAIEQLLNEHLLDETLYGNVIVAVTEGVLNAIFHGNNNDPSKNIDFSIDISEDELTVTIQDEGAGFDFKNLPDPTDPENLEKVNGRGIFIIRNLADHLEFEANGSRLKMSFKLNSPELVEA